MIGVVPVFGLGTVAYGVSSALCVSRAVGESRVAIWVGDMR